MTTAVDAGTVINPLNLEGQLEGGMDMGAGFALREQYIAGKTKDWVTFKYPTMKTAFDVEVIVRGNAAPAWHRRGHRYRRNDHGPHRARGYQRH